MPVTPYYQDRNVTIWHGDCREVLPRLSREVAAFITDPPYGVGYVTNRRKENLFGEIVGDDELDMGWLEASRHLWRFRTAFYVFANDDALMPTRTGLASAGLGLNSLLVWDKGAGAAGNLNDYATRTEYIVFATNGPVKLNGSRDSNLLAVPRVNPRLMVHPTEKPVELMSYLILKSTDIGELVIDPFMGSGPVVQAAKSLDRQVHGIEIEERYCELAAKRCAQEVLAVA